MTDHPAGPVRHRFSLDRKRVFLTLLAVIVVTPALLVRWTVGERTGGPHFDPRPDCLEYAASAEALALEERYWLHVGPHEVRPRYAPGWPMLLSVTLRLGMDAESLWRLTGAFGAAHAYVLAIISACGVRLFLRARPAPPDEDTITRRAFIAGALAGCGWAFAPISVEWGRTLMSDEAAAFLGTVTLSAMGASLLTRHDDRRAWVLATTAGLSAGWAMAMRPVVGYLLLAPAAVFIVTALIQQGVRRTLRRTCCALVGLALVVGLVAHTMWHSGHDPWEWSGYRFWLPDLYGRLDQTFRVEYALDGHPSFALRHRKSGEQLGNLDVAGRALLGLGGLPPDGNRGLGRYWPINGWLCGVALALACRRLGRRERLPATAWAAAALCWIAGHIAVYSLYFYPAVRFYLAPLAWCWVLTAVACAVWWGGRRIRTAVVLYAAGSATILTFMGIKPLFRFTGLGPDPDHQALRQTFAEWAKLSDTERAGMRLPFDPVHAQALGLLTPETLSRIRSWGVLPRTEHVWRLEGLGYSNDPAQREATGTPDP